MIFPKIPAARLLAVAAGLALLPALSSTALAHAVAEGDKGYFQEISGVHLLPFVYLGAKHMVTGYDHIPFLLGVVFFLYRLNHVALCVSLFALGHSTTIRNNLRAPMPEAISTPNAANLMTSAVRRTWR